MKVKTVTYRRTKFGETPPAAVIKAVKAQLKAFESIETFA